MDPNATIRELMDCQDAKRGAELCEALASWLNKGGFKPDMSTARYWPGTGTRWAILSPQYDTGDRWVLVNYTHKGERLREWTLS